MVSNPIDLVFNNEDLAREIFLRVPAKRLAKFKSICKHWLALISNPRFGHDHTVQNPNPLCTGIYFHYYPFSSTNLKSIPCDGDSSLPSLSFLGGIVEGSIYEILHSYNGLLLCSHRPEKFYSVCNPVTQKYMVLPKLNDGDTWNFMSCLGFDQARPPNYKVILIRPQKIHIFSSKEASWKSMLWSESIGNPITRVVYMDGVFHWLTTTNLHYQLEFSTEKLNTYELPREPVICGNNVQYFGQCGVHLFLVLGCAPSCFYNIYSLSRDAYSWISRFQVDLRHEIPLPVGEGQNFQVLTILKTYEGDPALVLAIPCGFMSYNLKRTTHEVLCDFCPAQFYKVSGHLSCYHANRFSESLFPL